MSAHAYRPDIDGLRAIAVLAVVVFHAFPQVFPSGFIGVDLFFVISGFLITQIISSKIANRSFSFFEFYSRRIIRIFPALVLMLATLVAVGALLLVSSEYRELGKHTWGASLFVSNWMLLFEVNYFDTASENKILLHLWSLAIEEQFYFIYPVLLWLAHRVRLPLLPTVGVLLCGSLLYSNFGILDPSSAFYLPHSRFWELMVGGVLALIQPRFQGKSASLGAMISAIGVVLIGLGFVCINGTHVFPSFWALFPTIGAAFVILGGSSFNESNSNRFSVYRLLSASPLVWIGKISYPLYLWHWVVFVVFRLIEGASANAVFRFVFILVSIGLAALTTRFVETPIRHIGPRRSVVVPLLVALLICGGLGRWIETRNGFPERDLSIQQHRFDGDIGQNDFYVEQERLFPPCQDPQLVESSMRWESHLRCAQSTVDRPVDTAIVGDSHAEHLFLGLAAELPQHNFIYLIQADWPYFDRDPMKTYLERVRDDPKIKRVLLSTHWISRGIRFDSIRHTLEQMLTSGKTVFLFNDNPSFNQDPSRCKSTRRFRNSVGCSMSRADFDNQSRASQAVIDQLKPLFPMVVFVDVTKYFCNEIECVMAKGKDLLYRDNNHLNIKGTHYLAEQLVRDYPELAR